MKIGLKIFQKFISAECDSIRSLTGLNTTAHANGVLFKCFNLKCRTLKFPHILNLKDTHSLRVIHTFTRQYFTTTTTRIEVCSRRRVEFC